LGSSPGGGKIFLFSAKRPDRLWAPPNCLLSGYRGAKRPGLELATDFHILPRLRMTGAMPLFTLYAVMAWTWTALSPFQYFTPDKRELKKWSCLCFMIRVYYSTLLQLPGFVLRQSIRWLAFISWKALGRCNIDIL
jgi:hypothetical protein